MRFVADTKPIPVRLSANLIERLDRVAERIGSNRAAVIRICTQTFIEHFEERGKASLPPEWEHLLRWLDNRTKCAREENPLNQTASQGAQKPPINLMPDSRLTPKLKALADEMTSAGVSKAKRLRRQKHV